MTEAFAINPGLAFAGFAKGLNRTVALVRAGRKWLWIFGRSAPGRAAWFAAHFPVYWGMCLVFALLGLGRLSAEQERKNRVSRGAVYRRVLEVQMSQLVSYVVVDQLGLMPDPPGIRWLLVGLTADRNDHGDR